MATVADFLVERMKAWGVRRAYGYPGDGVNGVMGALARAGGAIEFVQARHEEMAAFMACGHAKFSGETGVCIVTSGPGAIHVLNGLYDAKADHQPVVAILGQQARALLGSSYQQEVDLVSLFKDVASEYVQMITVPDQARHAIDRAFRIARAERCPTAIVLPHDVQTLELGGGSSQHEPSLSNVGYSEPIVMPRAEDLARAAAVLNRGEKVAMLVGAGAAGAREEILRMAELLQAGVAKALLGKAVVPDDAPFITGAIGLIGTRPTFEMMKQCDTLLMVGSGFPYTEFLPEEGQARGVQIDIDARMLGLRYPMEVNLQGDSARTLRLLAELIEPKGERSRAWRRKIEANVADWWKTLESRAMLEANPLNPQRVFHELSPRLPADALITTDTGSSVFWFARHIRMQQEHLCAHSGSLASMGAAIPYAIAAKFAHPSRPAIAMVGDGAMQMNGMNELITVAKYCKCWSDPRFVVLVLNNRDLNFVTWEQRILEGEAKFPASQDLPDLSYAEYARMLGFEGMRVDSPDDIAPAIDAAFAAGRPALIEAMVDPAVPMLPPHITLEQARHYLRALLKGDPDAARIIKASVKEVLA